MDSHPSSFSLTSLCTHPLCLFASLPHKNARAQEHTHAHTPFSIVCNIVKKTFRKQTAKFKCHLTWKPRGFWINVIRLFADKWADVPEPHKKIPDNSHAHNLTSFKRHPLQICTSTYTPPPLPHTHTHINTIPCTTLPFSAPLLWAKWVGKRYRSIQLYLWILFQKPLREKQNYQMHIMVKDLCRQWVFQIC